MIILMLSLESLRYQLKRFAEDNILTDAQADELADAMEARDARETGVE